MKKFTFILIAICMALSISSSVYADDPENIFTIKLREWFPGIDTGDITVGALASGNFFDSDGNNLGSVNISWSHNGIGIEECNGETALIRLRLVMNFNSGGRLVLIGPVNGTVNANWDFDDPSCPDGNCPLIGYSNFLDPTINPVEDLLSCDAAGDSTSAFIAQVPSFQVARQWFGSYGTRFRGGFVSGFLVHTPIVSPAVVGEVVLY